MKQGKVESLIGLSQRSGNLVSGEFSTEKAVKAGKAYLVIVAEDSSNNTKKLFQDKCSYYKIPYVEYGTKAILGQALGKELRASVAVLEKGFANSILNYLSESKQ